jgi:hypothetical protein
MLLTRPHNILTGWRNTQNNVHAVSSSDPVTLSFSPIPRPERFLVASSTLSWKRGRLATFRLTDTR